MVCMLLVCFKQETSSSERGCYRVDTIAMSRCFVSSEKKSSAETTQSIATDRIKNGFTGAEGLTQHNLLIIK